MRQEHIGSDFDDFLRDQELLEDVEAAATKHVIALQIAQEMKRHHLSKTEMARRMRTSRPAVDRLLDPANHSVTLLTLERAAAAVGKRLTVQLTSESRRSQIHLARECAKRDPDTEQALAEEGTGTVST